MNEKLTRSGGGGNAFGLRSVRQLPQALRCGVTLVCCLLLLACGQDQPEPPAPQQQSFRLIYSAGPNGRIEGSLEQQLRAGESGQPVTAVPAAGYHFSGWSDGLTAPERTERDLSGDLQLSASFAKNQYPVTYSATAQGSVKGQSIQTVAHGEDAQEVTAVPESGFRFSRWSDGLTTAIRQDKQVTTALAVSARFLTGSYQLEYRAGANGRIAGQTTQTIAPGGDGTPVQAIPAPNYHFAGWSDGVSSAERSDRNLTGNLLLTARFATETYPLSYSAAQNGTLSGPAEQLVARGESGSEVEAIPASGYHFVNWSDGVTTARRLEAAVTAALEVTANFARNSYALSYLVSEHGTLKGEAQQQIEHGSDAAPVEAVAAANYRFVRWSDGVTTARRLDSKLAGPLRVRAEFALETYRIGGRLTGLVEGTVLQLQNSAAETLTVSQNGEFQFATEVLNGSGYAVKVLEQPSAPSQTCLVSAGSGTVSKQQVTDIAVVCSINGYAIGGTLSGLPVGDQLVLQNNASDELVLKANGPFTFAQPLEDSSAYLVTVVSQPVRLNWSCELTNAAGALAGAAVTDLRVDCAQQLLLQVVPGRSQVELAWNATDFDQVTFNLCMAREIIPDGGFAGCTELQDGTLVTGIKLGQRVGELSNDVPYWFQLQGTYPSGRATLSTPVAATPFGGLNDSGIDWCADLNKNQRADSPRPEKERSCQVLSPGLPGQDAVYGRDAAARVRTLAKQGGGSAGFDFVKYCRSGEAAGEKKCAANPRPGAGYDEWACTLDKVTGLSWEIKTDSGLRASDKNYSWYLADEQVNGGNAGPKRATACETEACDTQGYIEAVNRLGLCGYRDWRLPTRRELLSIVDNGRIDPAIDSRYFPNSRVDYYWTSSSYQDQPGLAWQVYFFYGESKPAEKSRTRPVRLVRGQTSTFGQDNP